MIKKFAIVWNWLFPPTPVQPEPVPVLTRSRHWNVVVNDGQKRGTYFVPSPTEEPNYTWPVFSAGDQDTGSTVHVDTSCHTPCDTSSSSDCGGGSDGGSSCGD